MKVLITGATGFIGCELGKKLVREGHQIWVVSRNAEKAKGQLPFPAKIIEGDLSRGSLNQALFQDVEAVIHLAGENVGEGRWTPERKNKIRSSRVQFTQNLIQSLPASLKVFVSASATGYYGNRGDEALNEQSTKGTGFLADVCEQWESAVLEGKHKISQARFVILRTGVVFSPYGGALMKMLPPFQLGVAGRIGNGKQWMSWIHLQDLVQMYSEALNNPQWSGIYNAVAPGVVTNENFTRALCAALGVRPGLPAMAFTLKALFGEMASVILDSQKVQSERLSAFSFQFPSIEMALKDCAAPYQNGDQVFIAEQFLPLPREKVFPFFAEARNLETITPPLLNFQVEKMSTEKIQEGTLIDYKLKIRGVPVGWRTRIEEWNPIDKFVDTQLKGPYKKWHHTHTFEDLGSGTLMRDVVRYQLPLGKLGQVFGGAFVRGDVEEIFAYRQKVVPEILQKQSTSESLN